VNKAICIRCRKEAARVDGHIWWTPSDDEEWQRGEVWCSVAGWVGIDDVPVDCLYHVEQVVDAEA